MISCPLSHAEQSIIPYLGPIAVWNQGCKLAFLELQPFSFIFFLLHSSYDPLTGIMESVQFLSYSTS